MKNLIFLCEKCGADFPKWHGRCPNCKEWDTLSEFKKPKNKKTKLNYLNGELPKPINDFSSDLKNQRIKTNIGEFDRVLGGGFINGSLILPSLLVIKVSINSFCSLIILYNSIFKLTAGLPLLVSKTCVVKPAIHFSIQVCVKYA